MKTLTIWQPWASLIMVGAKPYEFRHWDYRKRAQELEGQRIVIHAGARPIKPDEIDDIFDRITEGNSALKSEIALPLLQRVREAYRCRGVLELSAGLGTAILGAPQRVTELFAWIADSDRLDHSVWAWPLTDIRPFTHPIPMRGAQGFWNWPDRTEEAA